MSKTQLDKQAKEIIRIAGESGVQLNYLFVTTFKRYRFMLASMERLAAIIEQDGEIITREDAKGISYKAVHPALVRYNSLAEVSNKTASTLIRIIKTFKFEDRQEQVDPLMKILNGYDEPEDQE